MLKNYTLFKSTAMVQISNLIALGLQNYVEIFISDCCNFLFISVKINRSPRYKFTYLISYRLDYILQATCRCVLETNLFIHKRHKTGGVLKSIPYTSRYKRYFHRNAGCYARREGDTEAVLGQPIPYESAHLWNKRRDVTEGRYA